VKSATVGNILTPPRRLPAGSQITDSNRHPGHGERMASHFHRIWNHVCERLDGPRCEDCIRREQP
jgi:hypothetical protein